MFDNGDRVIIKNNPSRVFKAVAPRFEYVDLIDPEDEHAIRSFPTSLLEPAPVQVKPGQVWVEVRGERLFVIDVFPTDRATFVFYASAKADPTSVTYEKFTSRAELEYDAP